MRRTAKNLRTSRSWNRQLRSRLHPSSSLLLQQLPKWRHIRHRRQHHLLPQRLQRQHPECRRPAASCHRHCVCASKSSGPRSRRRCRPIPCRVWCKGLSCASPIVRLPRRRRVQQHLQVHDLVFPVRRLVPVLLRVRVRRTVALPVRDQRPVDHDRCPRSRCVLHSQAYRRGQDSTRSVRACIVRRCRVRQWDVRPQERAAMRSQCSRARQSHRRLSRAPSRSPRA